MNIQSRPAEESAAQINLDHMTDAIWEEMQGQVDKQMIYQAIQEILPNYEDSRIWSFVPILMHRDVTEILHQRKPR